MRNKGRGALPQKRIKRNETKRCIGYIYVNDERRVVEYSSVSERCGMKICRGDHRGWSAVVE